MYRWIFRHIPGPLWIRICIALALVGCTLVLMVEFLFPWINQFTQFTDSTIGAGDAE